MASVKIDQRKTNQDQTNQNQTNNNLISKDNHSNVFWFCIGTAAELIKLYPIIEQAQARNLKWYVVSTGQSGNNLWKQVHDFQLPESQIINLMETRKYDLSSASMALKWFLKSLFIFSSKLRTLIFMQAKVAPQNSDLWFVHGDTLSTLVGAVMGRRLGLNVIHIEAGMRSHKIFNPFPEEISRRIVSRLAQIHFAPDEKAVLNLENEKIKSHVYNTHGNTVMDALFDVLIKENLKLNSLPEVPFVVANFHRFENLSSPEKWNKIIETVIRVSQTIKVVFVMMPNTIQKLELEPETKQQLLDAHIELKDRMPFSQFVQFLNKAEFVLTDGGSNQEECFYLGKPCLIMRDYTERFEGLEENCILSQFKTELINNFIENPTLFKRPQVLINKKPTDIVFETLNNLKLI